MISYDNRLKFLNIFKLLENRIIIIEQKNKRINSTKIQIKKFAKGEFILFFNMILYLNQMLQKNFKIINIIYIIQLKNSKIINNNKNLFLKLTEKNK